MLGRSQAGGGGGGAGGGGTRLGTQLAGDGGAASSATPCATTAPLLGLGFGDRNIKFL